MTLLNHYPTSLWTPNELEEHHLKRVLVKKVTKRGNLILRRVDVPRPTALAPLLSNVIAPESRLEYSIWDKVIDVSLDLV